MKTRFALALFTMLFALCGGIIVSASALAQSTDASSATSAMDATGNWEVQSAGERFNTGTITLHHEGATIVGHYSANGGGSISGTMGTATRLDATWTDARGTGWITCHFSPDFNSFDGEWGFQGKPLSARFVGKRLPGTPSPQST